ncbi:thioredoxin [Cryptosporidium ubiquitum]|uniref:Thioredoxin n=1 Tax=Cryptosporidium ubiquitum TaxID=857276 RepID=A0A1J4MME2_9CRYT|nr:thioredoxin [Cryptosporidium ubiquitum]OII75368.1 thioredoxin [Cryptosporidium ubiquitum]
MNINNEASNTRAMQLHTLNKLVSEKKNANEMVEISLESNINMSESFMLNCKGELDKAISIFEESREIIYSDVDEQMIIKISFIEPVSITKFGIQALEIQNETEKYEIKDQPELDVAELSKPRLAKLYVNSPLADFGEIEDLTPSFTKVFTNQELQEFSIFTLPGSKFHRLKHLTIFIEENQDCKEKTYFNKIKLLGYIIPS